MSSLTRRGENCPASIRQAHWSSEVQHHCELVGFSSDIKEEDCGCHTKERPSPEGAGGSKGDPHRNMCQRTYDVPTYKSLPGSLKDRISNMSSGGGTSHRGAMSLNPGFGRSERKVACCEKCSATLVALKKQALSLAVHHHLSCKDSSALSAFLHENLCVHSSRSTAESRERERDQGECGTCGANLNQLKQEAVHLALSRSQSSAKPPIGTSLNTGTLLRQNETKYGDRPLRETVTAMHQAHSRTHSPQSPRVPQSPKTPQRTPQTLRRRGPRLPNPDMDRWVEEQQQLIASASKSVSMTNVDGVTIDPYREAAGNATLGSGDAGTVQTSSKILHISRVVTIANSAAMSFLARAAQKLNLTSRKKCLASDAAPAHFSTCFREIIQKNPPPVPSCLLQAATRTKDSPNVGKVKVVLRVSPALSEDRAQPPVLRIDPSKKRVTVTEPVCKSQTHTLASQGREGKPLLKTYTFDAAYPQESSQAEVCAGVLADVIRCVVSGSDGCVLGLGCADVGSWSSMVGSDESIQRLGLIPCAISWLYSAIERRKEKTWTTLNVSVSAIELCCGQEDTLRDLLGESVPSSGSNIQDNQAAQISLHEDPVYGIQLRNHNRVKAPTAERAASLLDAAITARRHGDIISHLSHSSIMFFTLHVQPPLAECSTTGKALRGVAKLTMIDVCSRMRGITQSRDNKNKRPHFELVPVVLALLSGHKNIPNKGSKLTMLLRESLGHINCHTAVIAQVADSTSHLQESLCTIQLASRIRRTQKRAKESTSCSPCSRSLRKEKRGHQSLTLRAFHSTGEVDVDVPRFRLRGDLDERSSSDQSCDTVIQIDSDGLVQPKAASLLIQPEFVPIVPSLHPIKPDMDDPEFTSLLQELLRIPQLQGEKKKEETLQGNAEVLKAGRKQTERDCLKCETFAELQERLGCIDGSEATIDLLRLSSKSASVSVTPKSPQKKSGKQADSEATETSETLMRNQGLGCSQTYVGQQQLDGTFPGDNFQREDSGLYDCEECSAASSSEELLNQTHGPNMTCQASHSELPHTEALKSGDNFSSQGCESKGKQGSPEINDWFKPDKRTSPVGKSSPISPTSSQSVATSVICGDVLPNLPTEKVKEMKATITVTVQQPLDLKGQDELVFSMVEEVTISGALDKGRTGGNIICIRDTAQSPAHVQVSASSQPIRIISNIIEESTATGCSNMAKSVVQTPATEDNTQRPLNQFKREKRFLPSFINPMLINTNTEELDDTNQKESPNISSTCVKSMSKNNIKCPENERILKVQSGAFAIENHTKKCDSTSSSTCSQISYETLACEDAAFCGETAKNQTCGKISINTDRNHPRGREHVYSSNTPKGSQGGESGCRSVGKAPERVDASSGCQGTAPFYFKTASLPRGWHNSNHLESYSGGHMTDKLMGPRGVTSSTPCSPRVTLERRQDRQHSSANHALHVSPPQKYSREYRQEASAPPRKAVASLFEASSLSLKHDMCGRLKSPIEDSSRLFNAKLEQLTSRTNSFGRTTGDVQTLQRGSSSSTSVTSKGSVEGNFKAYKGSNEGDSTLPRASSSSPKKNPRSVSMANQSYNQISQTLRYTHSKLSAVGKLKTASPKVRRLSAPSTKNVNFSPKGLQQSINRSSSLSPDEKNLSLERTPSFLSSSPPRSFHSLSRTPSQSSTCSSTKSAIQGFVNGRITDLLKGRAASPTSGTISSPYSRVTAPRSPSHMSGHASDTTSVLSGDLPPAMGKTSLVFSNRNSMVSSGYDSMVRDSEATASSTSNRDSVSDRSSSLLSVAYSSRTSRRRGNTGSHQRRLSHDMPLSLRRSASGLRSRCVDREIPEAYEIKVYEIDDVERMQKRAGAGKQGPACFSAKLKFLEHRQQRISEVRAKYNLLRRELEQTKQNLMLEPTKWNQEFDLWQTFEVDSLEHLEALEVVTARLESKVNLCKANVMMVTSFDVSNKRRQKKRRRAERRHRK
ncbi:hypothetical protein LDENG_00000520 [Lucifuga dentata]|nr:hypothetical protein LDENG_00000520 [Lucifuga dentata]